MCSMQPIYSWHLITPLLQFNHFLWASREKIFKLNLTLILTYLTTIFLSYTSILKKEIVHRVTARIWMPTDFQNGAV